MTIEGIFLFFVILFASVVLHEVAHGWVALKFGDHTAKEAGRLTLNPIKHIDPVGTILLPAILAFIGAPIIGWAKPVPYDPENLKPRRFGEICVGLAGVAVNFTIAFMALAAFKIFGLTRMSSEFGSFLWIVMYINILLGLFNLLPFPPLDGSKLWITWLPKEKQEAIHANTLIFFLVLMFMIPYLPIARWAVTLSLWLVGEKLL